jgi:PAS domain S-box-containing protein
MTESARLKSAIPRRTIAPKRAEQLLRLEHTVARVITEADSVSAALTAAIRTVCETLHWDCGRFFRTDEEADVLRFAEFWAHPGPQFDLYIERSRKVTYTSGVGLVGLVWKTGEPLWVADVAQDPRASRKTIADEAGMHGALVFPMNSGGKIIGVLVFNSREIREPDEGLLQAIHVVGAQIGQFVQRKLAEEVLRRSEERFRNLTELSSDWYWEQDENFRFTMFSDNLHRRLGPTMESLLGKTRWEASPNASEAEWAAHRAMLEAHQAFRDWQWQRIDEQGNLKIASISGTPIFDSDGRFRGYRGIGRDVTESKRSEEALRRFRASMDMSDDMILLVDRKTMRFVDVNEAVCRKLGYSRTELLAMSPDEILPMTRAELEAAYEEMIATGATQALRSAYRCKDGGRLAGCRHGARHPRADRARGSAAQEQRALRHGGARDERRDLGLGSRDRRDLVERQLHQGLRSSARLDGPQHPVVVPGYPPRGPGTGDRRRAPGNRLRRRELERRVPLPPPRRRLGPRARPRPGDARRVRARVTHDRRDGGYQLPQAGRRKDPQPGDASAPHR